MKSLAIYQLSADSDNGDITKWNTFLKSLYERLSSYKIQKKREYYNVANIEDWGKNGKKQGIEINETNFKTFFTKISELKIEEYDSIKNKNLETFEIMDLNDVLSQTLNNEPITECPESNNLIIKGRHITLSNFVDSDKKLSERCGNATELKNVTIFALNTVFIDTDLVEIGNQLNLNIIAPTWRIVNAHRINLDGAEGKKHLLRPGYNADYSGQDGEPGLPGGPGGAFFGFGQKIFNSESLTISTNGGTGGPGQDGNNGLAASEASPLSECNHNPCYTSVYNTFLLNDGSGNYLCKRIDLEEEKIYALRTGDIILEDYKIYGGHGGNGGTGGMGGSPGRISLMGFDVDLVDKYATVGKTGKGGLGGVKGEDGIGEGDIVVKSNAKCKELFYELPFRTPTRPQNNGTDDVNSRLIQIPTPAVVIDKKTQQKWLKEYRKFLIENMDNRYEMNLHVAFLVKLDNNIDFKGSYDTRKLIGEFKALEKLFPIVRKSMNKVDLAPLYWSLLDKYNEYRAHPKAEERTTEYRYVQSYLYAAIMNILPNIDYDLEPALITNVLGNIETMINTVNHLKTIVQEYDRSENSKYKLDEMLKHNKEYNVSVEGRIKHAEMLIEQKVKPEIDSIYTKINQEIKNLVDEIQKLQEASKVEQEELKKKQAQLQKLFPLKVFFGVVKLITPALQCLGPVAGTAAQLAVGAATQAGESLIIGPDINVSPHANLSAKAKLVGKQLETINDMSIGKWNSMFSQVSNEALEFPELKSVVEVANNANKKLKEFKDVKEIAPLAKELKKQCDTAQQELEKEKKSNDKKIEEANAKGIVNVNIEQIKKTNAKIAIAIKTVKNIGKGITFGAEAYNTFAYLKNEKNKEIMVANAIEETEENFKELKQYEDKVHEVITPLLTNMQGSMQEVANKLKTKSGVDLDITKWQVQNILSDMNKMMEKLTKGYEMSEAMTSGIGSLKNAMDTLIRVYDRIQQYRENNESVNSIETLITYTVKKPPIMNPELRKDLQYLDIVINTNFLLKEYLKTMYAIRQMVFPYASEDMKGIILPSDFVFKHNSTSLDFNFLLSDVETQLQEMKIKFDKDKRSDISRSSRCTYLDAKFNKSTTLGPFYVWKNAQYGSFIAKLLSGEKITLIADIRKYDKPAYDAVKFSHIKLNFEAENATMQAKFNEILKKFKINTIHLGDSHYRYKKKNYRITTRSLDLNDLSEGLGEQGAKKTLRTKNPLLSPFATWTMKLIPFEKRHNSFEPFKEFEKHIDLVLTGEGSYIMNHQDDENHLDECMWDSAAKYYDVVDEYDEIDQIEKPGSQSEKRSSPRNKRAINEKLQIPVNQDQQGNMENDSSEKIINYIDYIIGGDNSNSSINLSIDFDNNTNNNTNAIQAITAVDINGNLTLSQLLAHKIFGSNKALNNSNYVSLEQKQNIRINELGSEILPIVNNSSLADNEKDKFTEYYNSAPQWYQSLFKDEPEDEQTKF